MRPAIQFVIFALLTASGTRVGRGQGSGATEAVSVSISAEETAKLGRPIMLHIVLRAESAMPLTITQNRHSGQEGEFNYQVFVTYLDGEPVADTEYGRKIRTHTLVRGYAPSMIDTLQRGNEIREDLDIAKLVQVKLLGTYVVQVQRDNAPPLNVRSNSVRIRVEP